MGCLEFIIGLALIALCILCPVLLIGVVIFVFAAYCLSELLNYLKG